MQAPAPQPPAPETQELLSKLRDIQDPGAVGWWPPAPGWWILATLLLASLIVAVLWWRQIRRKTERNRYRVEAVSLLQAIDPASAKATPEINEILKRVAVTTFSRTECGNLSGAQWIEFLARSASINCPEDAQEALLEHLYRGSCDPEKNHVFKEFAIAWVKQHSQFVESKEKHNKGEAAHV
ncbi:DUF4381 domain-containing protein [Microbulbifer sp. OS29]|uniref:DUF4381 domain-containing protein n=1 Tax=Microbulbifer okhotskensis TaxID=2926617 RepID=A0A9X2EL22_9GAMM|nr:DUF4381 domain-containing protein [Microbulbifer okhotskensis]MCO1333535.1 DUF4381 domain-containing protein [Microbulbifer okhotskensis]